MINVSSVAVHSAWFAVPLVLLIRIKHSLSWLGMGLLIAQCLCSLLNHLILLALDEFCFIDYLVLPGEGNRFGSEQISWTNIFFFQICLSCEVSFLAILTGERMFACKVESS